jgi:hypothetical protein
MNKQKIVVVFFRFLLFLCSSRHQIPCFKATERLQPPHLPLRTVLSQQYSVVSFATLRVMSCLHSSGLRCWCCNVVRFCCDLEAWNLVTATIVCYNLAFFAHSNYFVDNNTAYALYC